jgi:hypothetical protein
MRWTTLWQAAAFMALAGAVFGCSGERIAPSAETTAPLSIPLSLRGQDTLMRLTIPRTDQSFEPGGLLNGEICYLAVGSFRIDCFSNGSSLNLGPNDSTDLLTDCPLWGLSPLHEDKIAADSLKLYAVLSLVGGSIDRLPGTLADYLGQPGQHLEEAMELARLLSNEKRVEFQGHARGGNFMVTVELTDGGREKLLDAIDDAGESRGAVQMAASIAGQKKRALPAAAPMRSAADVQVSLGHHGFTVIVGAVNHAVARPAVVVIFPAADGCR